MCLWLTWLPDARAGNEAADAGAAYVTELLGDAYRVSAMAGKPMGFVRDGL
jgi:hypothetical protein